MATVTLRTVDFEEALSSHVDETKPDPLARRQIESLAVQWEEVVDPHDDGGGSSFLDEASSAITDGVPTCMEAETGRIRGRLTLTGEYLSVGIGAECRWEWQSDADCSSGSASQPDDRKKESVRVSLHFKLAAEASIIPLTQLKRLQKEKGHRQNQKQNVNKTDTEILAAEEAINREDVTEGTEGSGGGGNRRQDQRALAKVRAGMLERLKADPYVRLLLDTKKKKKDKGGGLVTGSKGKKHTKATDEGEDPACPSVLCEAHVKQSFTADGVVVDTEERVDVSDETLEGVRRSVFPSVDESLSVMELLLAMPFLPRTVERGSSLVGCDTDRAAANADGEKNTRKAGKMVKCRIGHRAVLRLLEDAMFDACEREGEDELIDDLNISGQGPTSGGESDCEKEGGFGLGGGVGGPPNRKKSKWR